MDGVYVPIAIEDLGDGRLRGYSDVLGLYVCWEDGRLRFFDPVTESYLGSHEEAESRAEEERSGRVAAESRAEQERAERLAAESRAGDAESRVEQERAERLAAESRAKVCRNSRRGA